MLKSHVASIKVAILILLAFVILAIFIGPKLITGSEGQGRSTGSKSQKSANNEQTEETKSDNNRTTEINQGQNYLQETGTGIRGWRD